MRARTGTAPEVVGVAAAARVAAVPAVAATGVSRKKHLPRGAPPPEYLPLEDVIEEAEGVRSSQYSR